MEFKLMILKKKTLRNEKLHKITQCNTDPQIRELLNKCVNSRGNLRPEGLNLCDEIEFDYAKRQEYFQILELIKYKIDELKLLSLKEVLNYSVFYGGYDNKLGVYPYTDVLLTIATMIGVNGVLIETPKKRLLSRISIANAGDQNAGKSFCNRDFILGNKELQIPPHGIPFIRDGIEDVTGASFIWRSFVEERSDFRYIYLNDEYKKWYQHSPDLRDLQKRIFESKPIRWALKSGLSVPAYEFKGSFILNFNINYSKTKGIFSINPDLRAILSRLILRAYSYNDRIHKFYQNRNILFNTDQAQKIRLFINLIYEITRKKHEIFQRYPCPIIKWDTKSFNRIIKVSEIYIEFLKEIGNLNTIKLNFGTRQIDNAIKIASNLSLFDYFNQFNNQHLLLEEKSKLYIYPTELAIQLGSNYLIDELVIRQPKPDISERKNTKKFDVPFGDFFRKLHQIKIKRWNEII